MNELVVWSGGIERANMNLCSGDVKEALAFFKNKTGKDAKLIILNPKNEHLASKVDDGIKVDYLGGCLTWEVWLSADDSFRIAPTVEANSGANEAAQRETVTPLEKTKMSTVNENAPIVDKFKVSDGKSRFWKGRPKTYKKRELPDELIKRLYRQGMGSKAIVSKLKSEQGIYVSYKTIQRILAGQR